MSEHPMVTEYRRLTETLRPRFEEFHGRYAKHLTKEDIGFMLHKAARTFCDPFNEPTALRYSMHPTIGYSLQLTTGLGMSFNKDTLDIMLITLPARPAENALRNSGEMPLILRIDGEPTMLLPGEELVPHTDGESADVVHSVTFPLTPVPGAIVNRSSSPMTVFIGGKSVVISPGESRLIPGAADDEDTHAEWLRLNEESDE